MRSTSCTLLLLVVALLLGHFVGQSKSQNALAPNRRWEYRTYQASGMEERGLNQLGDQGWELVAIYQQDPDAFRGVFKRRK